MIENKEKNICNIIDSRHSITLSIYGGNLINSLFELAFLFTSSLGHTIAIRALLLRLREKTLS